MIEENYLHNLVDEGLSQREIANRIGCSQSTVKYWLCRYSLKTKNIQCSKKNGPDDPRYVQRECKHHGVTEFILEPSRNSYRCRKCRSGNVAEQRRKLKRELVDIAGGKCVRSGCGYSKSIWALEFHHRDENEKFYDIGALIRDRKRDLVFKEIEKCDLLCSNCHAEVEEEKWLSRI